MGRVRRLQCTEVFGVTKQDAEPSTPSDVDLAEIKVPSQYREQIVKLVSDNDDLIAKMDSQLSHTGTVTMKIDVNSHPPIRHRPYRVPLNKRQVVDAAIEEMLEAGIIERSKSSWAFPLVVVKKKDGTERMCVDFRSLNKIY